ncbi:hypothetical protein HY339_03105 [Candidatus Gottesmanbacteria bacterium]|nr:hypothetical protein [Candidatus Gottesmanbacteria bacterium]
MPKIDEGGHIPSNEAISEASVRANLEVLLASLKESPQDCGVYRAVITGVEGYYGSPFAGMAGEFVIEADRIHREGMGDLWQHVPGCPLG